ncbi:lactose ABC transporter permease [Marinococcus halophilus]|uniref:Lactose ABC transporter permease n=2 Tax=Marinococcus halophilus TaxID=1371 RepID=A0A510Y314_MARHA|nr:lactose ABC transporter permease [Marinococcus halophilus]
MSNMENVNSEHAQEKTKTKKKWITPKTFPYILVFPAVLLFVVFTVYPVISSFLLSFQASEGGVMSFVGFQNYIRLFNDGLFYQSLINTFTILIIQVPIMITLAILLAVMLNSALIRFNGFFRVSFFLPSVTALVTASIVFIILLDGNYGIVNYVLSTIGLEKVSWLNDPFWAKVSIMLVVTWRWTGYNMVILLAGLQNVSQDLYESASIDGAGKVRQFFYITLPQLKPVILFTVVLSTIGTLQLFDEPYILTNGGPNNSTLTVIMYLYDQGFRYFDFGYASAIAYVLVIIIAVLSWIQLRLGSDRD